MCCFFKMMCFMLRARTGLGLGTGHLTNSCIEIQKLQDSDEKLLLFGRLGINLCRFVRFMLFSFLMIYLSFVPMS